MGCDFEALANIDPADPEQANRLLQQCTDTLTDPTLWIWGIVLTVICAAVGAWIGRNRNTMIRDAVLGASLGPIGWIISFYLPKRKPALQCPACKGSIDAADKHCRHCGAAFASGQATS